MKEFVTSDLALVTYLRMNGFDPVGLPQWVMPAHTCYWKFEEKYNLMVLVEIFRSKEARVEPTEYNRLFGETKKELHETRPVTLEA